MKVIHVQPLRVRWIPLVCSCFFVSLGDMGIHLHKTS
jgi:hypothetical protein